MQAAVGGVAEEGITIERVGRIVGQTDPGLIGLPGGFFDSVVVLGHSQARLGSGHRKFDHQGLI